MAGYLSSPIEAKLAREIAIGNYELGEILERFQLSTEQWEAISASPRFRQLLEQECIRWNSAINTEERVRLKAAAIIEEWLLEANQRLHDRDEVLSSKVGLAQTIAKFAGIGVQQREGGEAGDKFSLTINFGGNKAVTIEKDVTPKVIEGEKGG